jgi:cardiolipin synthase
MSTTQAAIIVTGPTWMGDGVGSIESQLERLFREAEDELIMTAYSITGGADPLFAWLEAALTRGVYTRLVVNRLAAQNSTYAITQLRRLAASYPHFELYDFNPARAVDLHAKAVVADRCRAIVGSSNLSRNGLLINYEIAVALEGEAALTLAQVLDRLLHSRQVVRVK